MRSWLVLCLLFRIFASEFQITRNISVHAFAAQDVNETSFTTTPVVLSNGWPIKRVVANPSGDFVFAGGDVDGGADGLILLQGNRWTTIARTGDPVPGRPGFYFYTVGITEGQTTGNIALNSSGVVLFTARLVSCNPRDSGCSSEGIFGPMGLFLHTAQGLTTIAVAGDPAPGMNFQFDLFGEVNTTYGHGFVALSEDNRVAFRAVVRRSDADSIGFFIFENGRVSKITAQGDPALGGGTFDLSEVKAMFVDDSGTLVFETRTQIQYGDGFLYPVAVFRYQSGLVSRLIGQGDPAPDGSTIEFVDVGNTNKHGDVVYVAGSLYYPHAGLYVLTKSGTLTEVVAEGDPTPIGKVLSFFGDDPFLGPDLWIAGETVPQINDSGDLLYWALVSDSSAVAGLLLKAQGLTSKVVAHHDSVPGRPDVFDFTLKGPDKISFNSAGQVAFAAHTASDQWGVFSHSNGQLSTVFVPDDLAPGTDGEHFQNGTIKHVSLSDNGDVLFTVKLCCGKFTEGIFRAVRGASTTLPQGGFETSGRAGLPAGWETWWTNSGNGKADQYNSGGADAFEGNSALRLYTGPGGGSMFVLSDPIPITQGTSLQLTAQMRFYFTSNSDRAYFSVIQEDSSGKSVAFDEVTGVRGDSYWNWIAKGIAIRPAPGASRIRIRFGLVTVSESYLDVDAVR